MLALSLPGVSLPGAPGAVLYQQDATPPRRQNVEPVHDAVDELLIRLDGGAQDVDDRSPERDQESDTP